MILLRSGIGPIDDPRNAGIDPVIDLPGVGRNLQDHPLLRLPFGTTLAEATPPLQTLLTCTTSGAGSDPELQIFPAGPRSANG